jgi:hypothetical protein
MYARLPEPPVELLKELFSYDPTTGYFMHKKRRRGAPYGKRAGCSDKDGYWKIKVCGKYYRAHLCAWLMIYGEWPSNEIDHRNRDPSDNRIDNLRLATRSQQRANSRGHSGTLSRYKGVTRVRSGKQGLKWRAQICKDGKWSYLGWFDAEEDAATAYSVAAKRMFGEFAVGG